MVAVNKPPITTVANGLCTSAPAFVDIAIGKKPRAAAEAVSNTALNLSLVPCFINASKLLNECFFSSLKCSIKTIPLSTAIPKSAIKPTPADILNGKPRIHKSNTPPTAANGIAE